MIQPVIQTEHNHTKSPNADNFFMHTHEMYEIYCFLSGDAKYFVEGTVYPLKPNDILIIKKAEAHTLLISSEVPYHRIVVNFNSSAIFADRIISFLDSRPLGQYNRYPAKQFPESHWVYYLTKICESDDFDTKQIYLNVLLSELFENADLLEKSEYSNETLVNIITYINRHLSEQLSLDILCEKFYISKSHLNRKFRQITGSTVWEYIKTKRLILAKELLQNGLHPTAVSVQCGFQDYSAFFYAYKAKFGVSPKNDINKEHR